MIKYIAKKLLMMIPMLLVISALLFFGMKSTGIDPVNFLVSPDVAADEQLMESLRDQLGLNDPPVIQYFRWLGEMLKGNFGTSIVSGTAILDMIRMYLPNTIELALLALILSTILGVLIGILSAVKQNGMIDYIGRTLAVLGQAIPQFIIATILLLLFSIKLGWLPVSGQYAFDASSRFLDGLRHLILPLAAMVFAECSIIVRYARNSMLDIMNSDFIKLARSKGIPEWKVYLKHGFRNSMRPVIVVVVFRISTLFSGSVVIETVFNWPGIGSRLTQALVSGDYTVVMVLALVIAASVLVASFMLDVISAALDPRVRLNV